MIDRMDVTPRTVDELVALTHTTRVDEQSWVDGRINLLGFALMRARDRLR